MEQGSVDKKRKGMVRVTKDKGGSAWVKDPLDSLKIGDRVGASRTAKVATKSKRN